MAAGAPARLSALTAAAVNMAVTVWLLIRFPYGSADFHFSAARVILDNPKMGFNVGIDGMSLVMVVLTSLVTLAAVLIRPVKAGGEALYYSSSLLIESACLCGCCCMSCLPACLL